MTDSNRIPRRAARSDAVTLALRREVEGGRFGADGILPGERELAASLNVSRTTLRRAVAALVDEGVLSHRQGVGTFVVPSPAASNARPASEPSDDGSLWTTATAGREVGRETAPPTPEEALMLAVSRRDDVLRITRLLFDGDVAVAVERAVAPRRLLPAGAIDDPSLAAALARAGHRPARSLTRVRVGALGAIAAGRLGVPPESPAVLVERASYLAPGGCCLLTRVWHRADLFDGLLETGGGSEPDLHAA